MEEKKNSQKEEKKMINIEFAEYEKLQTENVRLRSDMQRALAQMQQMNDVIVEKRLSFMFRVIENSGMFNDDFVQFCADEIKDSLFVRDESEKPE